MCRAISEGGQRCEAHSRPRYECIPQSDPAWLDIARDYASTPEGHAHLEREANEAREIGDLVSAALLRVALLRGETLRAANAETERLLKAGRRRSLGQDEINQVRDDFGVATEQVIRDHAISHVLGALSDMDGADDLIFFGGTALSRTFLPTLRLSEDIDLIARGNRTDLAHRIQDAVAARLRRSHGEVTWTPSLADRKGADAAVLRISDTVLIRVQLLSAEGYPAWPTEQRALIQRYTDAPAATLTTLTAPAFVANKTAAWADRHAPRDLYDLWALGEHGHIDTEAADLFRRYGQGGNPETWLTEPPTDEAWQAALAHQGHVRISATDALAEVKQMWRSATGDQARN
jgi:predicted nucleotidyltransferase component of viral defense system